MELLKHMFLPTDFVLGKNLQDTSFELVHLTLYFGW